MLFVFQTLVATSCFFTSCYINYKPIFLLTVYQMIEVSLLAHLVHTNILDAYGLYLLIKHFFRV